MGDVSRDEERAPPNADDYFEAFILMIIAVTIAAGVIVMLVGFIVGLSFESWRHPTEAIIVAAIFFIIVSLFVMAVRWFAWRCR